MNVSHDWRVTLCRFIWNWLNFLAGKSCSNCFLRQSFHSCCNHHRSYFVHHFGWTYSFTINGFHFKIHLNEFFTSIGPCYCLVNSVYLSSLTASHWNFSPQNCFFGANISPVVHFNLFRSIRSNRKYPAVNSCHDSNTCRMCFIPIIILYLMIIFEAIALQPVV